VAREYVRPPCYARGNCFPGPYDVDLLNNVVLGLSVDLTVIMMTHCMAIMYHWGGAMSQTAESSAHIHGMEGRIKELEG